MNWVDYSALIIFISYVYFEYRRGFLALIFEAAGLFFSFYLALLLYKYINLTAFFAPDLAKLASFIAVLILVEIIFFVLKTLILGSIPAVVTESWPNKILGILPAAAKIAMIILILLTIAPFWPNQNNIQTDIKSSWINRRFASSAISFLEKTVRENFGSIAIKRGKTTLDEEKMIMLGFTSQSAKISNSEEEKMLLILNKERQKSGLANLTNDENLKNIARSHSKDMYEKGYFSHNDLQGQTPADRLVLANFSFKFAGENLALSPTVEAANEGLMNSPKHRDNILNKNFNRVGIGVLADPNYGLMITENFAN